MQAGKFVQRFHSERKMKLSHILDSERWKQAEVPPEFQALITYIHQNECFPCDISQTTVVRSDKASNFMHIGSEKYAVVGTVLILIQIVQEYCRYVISFIIEKTLNISRFFHKKAFRIFWFT